MNTPEESARLASPGGAVPQVLALGLLPEEPARALRQIRHLRRLAPGAVLRYPPQLAASLLSLLCHDARSGAAQALPVSGAWVTGSDALFVPAFAPRLRAPICTALEAGIPVLTPDDAATRQELGHAALYLAGSPGWAAYLSALDLLNSDEQEREALARRGIAWAKHLRRKLEDAVPAAPWLEPSWAATVPSPLPVTASPRTPSGSIPHRPARFRRLSVVMALHGQRALTERCLETLRADLAELERDQEAEIICVDNASPDDTRMWLRQQPDLHLVLLSENRGCAGGWNAGLRAATGDLLCVLNNDTLIHAGGIRALARAAWEAGIAAMAGGVLNRRLEFVRMTAEPEESDYPDGCALAFRRDVFTAVGPFDEAMGLGYCEDSDWGLRARSKGYRWELVPGILTHLGGQTAQTVPGVSAGQASNQERLRQRWLGKGVGERIAVRRDGALGDVVLATPVLRALREAQPLARIILQCTPDLAVALQGLPVVDGVTAHPHGRVTRRIDLTDTYERLERAGEWRHPVLAYAEAAGVAVRDFRYFLPEVPEWEEWAAELLPELGYIACGLRSVCRPKANWSGRGWRELAAALPERALVAFDPQPQPALDPHARPADGRFFGLPNVLDLTGRTPTLRQLIALLRRCSLCVTVDTGLWHLAAALGLPTVALVGGAAGWARCPLVGRHRILMGQAPCYPCRNASHCTRSAGPHCLQWLDGNLVADAVRELLAEASAASG